MNLSGLVDVLELQNSQKADYIINPKDISYEGGFLVAKGTVGEAYVANDIMHSQIADKLGIPNQYYKKMRAEADELLEANVNGWFKRSTAKGYMIRTFEGTETGNIGRSLLSDRYSALDNYDVLFAALDAIRKSGIKVEVRECSVTEKGMHVNIVAPEIEVQAPELLRNYLRDTKNHVGFGIVSGFKMTNSEVGYGSYNVAARALIGLCNNGMTSKTDSFNKIHLGGQLQQGAIKWSSRTVENNRRLVLSQTTDAVRHFLSKDYLKGMVQKLEDASRQTLEQPYDTAQNVVKHLATKCTINEEHKKTILNYFVGDGDQKASGVFQALTRAAQHMNADDQHDLEVAAFEILPSIKKFDKPFIGKN